MTDRACGIGVDGGGSKTTVVCYAFDEAGTVLGRGQVGATNPNSVGDKTALERLVDGIETALREAGRCKDDVQAVTLGMSGVDRPADRVKVQKWMKELFPHLLRPGTKIEEYDEQSQIRVHNDGTIALCSGTNGDLNGVVVISGTGTISIAYRNGESKRSSGMGPALGDVGSGFDIGRRLLKAVTFANDGRGPKTIMTEKLLEHLKLEKVDDLIPWAYGDSKPSWDKTAALAPVVQKCAEAGDPVAKHILEKSAAGLANSIRAAAENMNYKEDEEFKIVYSGGLMSSGVLVPYLTPLLQAKWKRATIINPSVEPVYGAVYLNLRLRK